MDIWSTEDSLLEQSDDVISDRERLLHDSTRINASQELGKPEPVPLQIYTRRWYILLLFSSVVFTQGLVWNTWGPINKSAERVFGWSDATVGLLSNWGPITFIIGTPFFTWLLDVKGLRYATLLTALLVAMGTGLRCLPVGLHMQSWLIHLGHILNGFGGPVCMGGVTLVSATWFPVDQRVTATAISSVSSGLGVGVAFIIGPLIVIENSSTDPHHMLSHVRMNESEAGTSDVKSDIMKLLYIEFAWAAALFLLVLIYFPPKPPTPPSVSASTERVDYKLGIQQLFRKPMFWVLGLTYGISGGVYNTWESVLEVNLKSRNISQKLAGWLGFYSMLAGTGAGLLVARFADIFKRHIKLYLIVLFIGAMTSFYVFTIAFDRYIPLSEELMYSTNIITGLCIMGAVPLFYELCCEVAYPVAEGLTSVSLACLNNIFGLIFLLVLMIPNIGTLWMNWFCLGSIVICLPALLFMKERYGRLDVDITVSDENEPAENVEA